MSNWCNKCLNIPSDVIDTDIQQYIVAVIANFKQNNRRNNILDGEPSEKKIVDYKYFTIIKLFNVTKLIVNVYNLITQTQYDLRSIL